MSFSQDFYGAGQPPRISMKADTRKAEGVSAPLTLSLAEGTRFPVS